MVPLVPTHIARRLPRQTAKVEPLEPLELWLSVKRTGREAALTLALLEMVVPVEPVELKNSVELRAQGWEPAQWRNGETDDLAVELATLANLDVGHMLEGRLVTDSEWSGFAGGLAKLNERHPDKAAEIAALVDRVNVAAEALEGAP